MQQLQLGHLHVDHLGFGQAIDAIAALVEAGHGGYVLTPNVDHVVLAETDPQLQRAYAAADLSLADGMPLVWLSHLLGAPLPAKVSGSDLALPLLRRAAAEGWRVYLLGGAPGVARRAAGHLLAQLPGLHIVGTHAPPFGFAGDRRQRLAALRRLQRQRPQLVLIALGCPQQETLAHSWRAALAPAVAVCVGATLDFIAGEQHRAPPWLSRVGLEWLYRLGHEPRRLAQRYLVRDRAIIGIGLRALLARRQSLRVEA